MGNIVAHWPSTEYRVSANKTIEIPEYAFILTNIRSALPQGKKMPQSEELEGFDALEAREQNLKATNFEQLKELTRVS